MTTMDYGALPPEVNSARMYAGAGSGPMAAATQAWDRLAAELQSAAVAYQEVVSSLASGPWVGASSESMATAAAPYVAWMNTTAGQARQTAGQLKSAIAAYETAFAATVPPAEIEVNRAMLASLVPTNVLGQNTAAITALEAQYTEMWAQDAAAMYGYATASAAASVLTPFTAPTQHTTAAEQPAAATSTSADSGISGLLLSILNSPLIQEFERLSAGLSGVAFASGGSNFLISGTLTTMTPMLAASLNPMIGLMSSMKPASSLSQLLPEGLVAAAGGAMLAPQALGASVSTAAVSGGVSGAMGDAASVGPLSVPRSWGTASPEIRLAARSLPIAGSGLPHAEMAGTAGLGGGMPLVGPVGSVVNAPREDQSRTRSGPRQRVIPAQPGAPDMPGALVDARGYRAKPNGAVSEHDELEQLRRKVRDVARQRDALKRTAALLIQEASEK